MRECVHQLDFDPHRASESDILESQEVRNRVGDVELIAITSTMMSFPTIAGPTPSLMVSTILGLTYIRELSSVS